MGGTGSGWFRGHERRPTTAGRFALDVRLLQRHGVLREGTHFHLEVDNSHGRIADVEVFFTRGGFRMAPEYQKRDNRSRLPLDDLLVDWTACRYGGSRPWFLCPRANCGRRVALLFWDAGFACRQCLGLAYECQREQLVDRLARRVAKIKRRLGPDDPVANQKPKQMHLSTYRRLISEIDASEERAALYFCGRP
jgi:hypothetical protein